MYNSFIETRSGKTMSTWTKISDKEPLDKQVCLCKTYLNELCVLTYNVYKDVDDPLVLYKMWTWPESTELEEVHADADIGDSYIIEYQILNIQ
jgi:hypothetical protein